MEKVVMAAAVMAMEATEGLVTVVVAMVLRAVKKYMRQAGNSRRAL